MHHPLPATLGARTRRVLAPLLGVALALSLAAGASAAAPFPGRIDLPLGWQPEGITSSGTTAWVGSLANGAIREVNLRTGDDFTLVPGGAGQVAVGIDYEAEHDRLWVAGGPTGAIRVYDASTGDPLATYQVTAGFLNDVIVTEDAAYVTDSASAQLIVIPLGEDGSLPAPSGAFSLPLTGDIVVDPAAFNANGIVAAKGWLLIVQSNTGLIFRVDPETGVTTVLEGDYDASFGDGLEIRGNTVWVVRNQVNRVAVLRVNGQLTRATEIGTITGELAVPTTATIAAGSLWAVNARFGTPPAGAEYWITRLPVMPND
jgi:streptogramin lyase